MRDFTDKVISENKNYNALSDRKNTDEKVVGEKQTDLGRSAEY